MHIVKTKLAQHKGVGNENQSCPHISTPWYLKGSILGWDTLTHTEIVMMYFTDKAGACYIWVWLLTI